MIRIQGSLLKALLASFTACFMHQATQCKASYQQVKQGARFEACSLVALGVYKAPLYNVRVLLCECVRDHHGQEQKHELEKSEPAITCSMVHQILYTLQWLFHAFHPCKAKVQVVSYSLGLE